MPNPITKEVDFFTALAAISAGAKATKSEWNDPRIFILLRNSKLQIYRDRKFFDLIISEGDLIGLDWVLTQEPVVN
jgi:hypothetical protein